MWLVLHTASKNHGTVPEIADIDARSRCKTLQSPQRITETVPKRTMPTFTWMSFKLLSGMRSRKLVTGAGTSLGWCKTQVVCHHPTASYYANWYEVDLQPGSCNTRYGNGLAHHVADQSGKFHKCKVMTNHDKSPVAKLSNVLFLLDKGIGQQKQNDAAMESKLQCHQANESFTWDQTSDNSACPLV